ncbi:pseudaminic acid synthase [Candidatus Omnitrophota bacterium]
MFDFKRLKRCFIVAEISANHRQNYNRAVSLIKKAKQCGADAVKFQAYTPDTLTIDANNKYFRIKHLRWGGQTLYQLYKKSYIPWAWLKKLKAIADDLGIIFFATAFDSSAVDFLEQINVPVHKIASFEIVDLPLIEHAAQTKKPLIISTGMATVAEINQALGAAKDAGAKAITLLKCVSSYPAAPEQMNLRTIPEMNRMFNCPVGLSDHSLGITVAQAAVALGARVIEKHFTLSRKRKTADGFFSVEPKELKMLVENIRITEQALGDVHYGLTKQESQSRVFRRSLFAVEDIRKGDNFTAQNIKSIRPGNGLPPESIKDILDKKAKTDIKRGTPLSWKMTGSKKGTKES